jgi:uncharacterized protein (DUF2062 family)
VFVASLWALPYGQKSETQSSIWQPLATGIDWVGALLASISLGLISYILAQVLTLRCSCVDADGVHSA